MKKAMRLLAIILLLIVSINITAFASETPTITAGTASGKPGETVSIPLSISNNSGIIALYCSVKYDDTQLKLTKVTNGSVLADPAHSGSLAANPYRLCFDMSLSPSNNTNNGVFATLEFEILSTAKLGGQTISISYNPNEIYDFDQNNVFFELVNGKITILSEDTDASQANNSTEPQNTATPAANIDNKIHLPIAPTEKTPWDNIIINGENVDEKNITTEQTDDGVLIRGNDLSGVNVEIQKGDKTSSVEINTDQNEVLLKENENGEIGAYIDTDGDGEFETQITTTESKPNKNNTTPLIIIAVLFGVAVLAIIFFLVRNKTKENNF